MKQNLVYTYSDDAFIKIVSISESYKDCLLKLGYHSFSGPTINLVKKRIKELNIDTSHFYFIEKIKRSPENIFCENNEISSKGLRKWYRKGNYTPYICSICGQKPIWNDKPMTLILDHINGYKTDNRLENLRWVCPNCNSQLDTTNGKNINHGVRKLYYCIDCGSIITNKSERCDKCKKIYRKTCNLIDNENQIYNYPKANKLVKREELKDMIYNNSFLQVGKYYGVTDNAVRKWCRNFNLPTRRSEIEKYNKDEWNKI